MCPLNRGKGTIKLNIDKRPEINDLISQLDSSSGLISQDEIAVLANPIAASIGDIELKKSDHLCCMVVSIQEDTPVHNSGLDINDRIVEIDGEPIKGFSVLKAYARLPGAPESETTIKILNPDNKEKTIKIKRQVIDNGPIVFEGYFKENKIGYIRVSRFQYLNVSDKIKSALKSLLKEDMRGLIIDLRGNPGGILNDVIESSQLFIKRGLPIVQLTGIQSKTYYSGGWSHYTDFPITVLIDRETGFGAEAMAAALRRSNHAVLVGEGTRGEGSVRSWFKLQDGSMLAFRSSFMLTPDQEQIEHNGIRPDIEVKLSFEAHAGLYRMIRSYYEKGIETSSDAQLAAAISYLAEQIKKHELTVN